MQMTMPETSAHRKAKRRYLAEFLAAMAAYALAVLASSLWLRAHAEATAPATRGRRASSGEAWAGRVDARGPARR
ncbi:MAG TPA: hypothetical protein VF192_16785 [Longimicrobiales bacterium]